MSNEQTKLTLTTKQSNKVKRALKAIEEVRKEVDAQCVVDGGVNWYVEDNDHLYLMDGYTHDDKCRANHGMVIAHFAMPHASGGGW
jgi:hypothetical protein